MIKITYKEISLPTDTRHSFLFLTEIKDGVSDEIRIDFSGSKFTFADIAGIKRRLNNGTTDIALSEIPDGAVEITVFQGTKSVTAAPFMKEGKRLSRLPLDNASAALLERSYAAVCEKLSEVEDRLSSLEEKISPKTLLNF